MFHGTLTLMSRSLRVDSRLLRTHLFRLLFVGIILMVLFQTQMMGLIMGAPGLRFFYAMAYLNFMFITLAAISFFATAITEEKEEDTLGLLKMAGLSPVSILLGKSSPRLIVATTLLSLQFPFTLLAITLGGIALAQVLAAFWSLLAYMVFVANLALFFSVVCKRSRAAAGRTATLLALFFIGAPIGSAVVSSLVSEWRLDGNHWLLFSSQWLLDALYLASITSRRTRLSGNSHTRS